MKKLGSGAYEEIRTWIYRNARPLDLAMWQYCFEKGSGDKVLDALGFYQNLDGGFGGGLEADNWNPESSPVTTMTAIGILQEIGLTDRSHPMVAGILRFLENTAYSSDKGWFFTIPSNDLYPHAPWWTFEKENNERLGITAVLSSFVLRFGDGQSKVYEKAAGYVERILNELKTAQDCGEMGVDGLSMLLHDIETCGLTDRFDVSVIRENLRDIVNRSIERDPEKWRDYTSRPSEFIWSADCPFYAGNEEIVDRELDYTIETRHPGGVWDITWTWFELGKQYGKEFAVSENWWKAKIAVDRLRFLKSFDRI